MARRNCGRSAASSRRRCALLSKHVKVYFVTFTRRNDPLGYLVTASNWQRALKAASDMYAKDHKGDRIVRQDSELRVSIKVGSEEDRKIVEQFGTGSFIDIRMCEQKAPSQIVEDLVQKGIVEDVE